MKGMRPQFPKMLEKISKTLIQVFVQCVKEKRYDFVLEANVAFIKFLIKSVEFIGKDAFKNCKQLKELIILNENCKIEGPFFKGCESLTKIHIP